MGTDAGTRAWASLPSGAESLNVIPGDRAGSLGVRSQLYPGLCRCKQLSQGTWQATWKLFPSTRLLPHSSENPTP